MTKIKNTKKGMAKKTLSVSLAVAMLATSNVPVWAAEFSDGTDAAFTAEVENQVAEETPAVEVEVPVADDTVDIPSAQVADEYAIDAKITLKEQYNRVVDWNNKKIIVDTENTYVKLSTNGQTSVNVTPANYEIAWRVDGEIQGSWYTNTNIAVAVYDLTASQANLVGKTIELLVRVKTGTDTYTQTVASNAITVQPVNLSEKYGLKLKNTVLPIAYDGEEHKFSLDDIEVFDKTAVTATVPDLQIKNVTYSADVTNAGTVTMNATYGNTAYTGVLSGTYTINKVDSGNYVDGTGKPNFDVSVKAGTTVEYDNQIIELDKTLFTVKDKVATANDYSNAISKVKFDASHLGEYDARVIMELKEGTLYAQNFNSGTNETDSSPLLVKVTTVARDLSKCTATIKNTSQIKAPTTGTEVTLDASDVIIKDANGKVLNLNGKIKVEVAKNNGQVGSYDVTILPISTTTKEVINSVKTTNKLEITERNFDGAQFVTSKSDSTIVSAATAAEDYTGSQIVKDLKDLHWMLIPGSSNPLELGVNYTISFGENVNAGEASAFQGGEIIITGLGGYAGCKSIAYFTIKPATVTDNTAKLPKEVLYNNAEGVKTTDYAAAVSSATTITAVNSKNAVVKTLEEGDNKDYTLTIDPSFYKKTGSTYSKDSNGNIEDNYIKVTVNLKNSNFSSASTIVKYVRLTRPVIEDANIILNKTEYTYTGKDIELDYKVVVGNKTLVKDTDYEVVDFTGINAGEGSITIKGKGNYDSNTTATAKFTIKKADANNVTVTVTAPTFDGKAWNGTTLSASHGAVTYTVKLGDVDVYSQFKATYGENINAGKEAGSITLTPTAAGAKNFENVKEVKFEIKQATLTGTIRILDKDGLTITGTSLNQKYDGTAKEFATVKFTPAASTPMLDGQTTLVEGKDYIVKYYNNVDASTTAEPAYVYVQALGNYTGTDSITGTKVSSIVSGTKISFNISTLEFNKSNVSVENGVYAGGLAVRPIVKVIVSGKTLVEGKDYKVILNPTTAGKDGAPVTEVTNGKTEELTIKGLGGYKGMSALENIAWGVDKKDLSDTSVTAVQNTDGTIEVVVMNNTIKVPDTEYVVKDNGDGTITVTPAEGNKHYIGSKTVEITEDSKKFPVGTAMISDVVVTGNTATVKLAGDVDNFVGDGEVGYDYVISKAEDYINERVAIDKNGYATETDFCYLEPGTYYAYCHAWTRDEDGKKAFGDWSNLYKFEVTAETPEKPQITSVKVSGSTVTVTYTECEGAEGYDIVLGSTLGKDAAGYKRPYDYGKLVKKNVKAGTTTVTFKDVPAGTYYVGLHAWNKTSEDGKKVFSKWSNIVTRTVK